MRFKDFLVMFFIIVVFAVISELILNGKYDFTFGWISAAIFSMYKYNKK